MTEQIKMQIEAKLLTGFEFLRHPDNPNLGLLGLRTETEKVWVLVSRKDLRSLAELALRHIDDVIETNQ
jgi:hypothetical protein